MGYVLTEASEWKEWLTPKAVRERAIHRWYVFPHSFTDKLVHALIDEWQLTATDKVLDPFVGAGTTIVASRERGVPAIGCDLSPLAVFATNTKVATYCTRQLTDYWGQLSDMVHTEIDAFEYSGTGYPMLVRDALSRGRLDVFAGIYRCIDKMGWPGNDGDFFRLALVSLIPEFSDAVASGGWLRWTNGGRSADDIWETYCRQIARMLSDVEQSLYSELLWKASMADARRLPMSDERFSAVITSPPYPNRHDYTRVFGIELMTFFLSWEQNRALRHQSFHSHPEARPQRPAVPGYVAPLGLEDCISNVGDGRLRRMLRGYFLDLYLCLSEIARVCAPGARIGIVVGNAQYGGNAVMVDEYTAELGERAGLRCREIRVVRWRGNSAQQMKTFGRKPSRESIVVFRKT